MCRFRCLPNRVRTRSRSGNIPANNFADPRSFHILIIAPEMHPIRCTQEFDAFRRPSQGKTRIANELSHERRPRFIMAPFGGHPAGGPKWPPKTCVYCRASIQTGPDPTRPQRGPETPQGGPRNHPDCPVSMMTPNRRRPLPHRRRPIPRRPRPLPRRPPALSTTTRGPRRPRPRRTNSRAMYAMLLNRRSKPIIVPPPRMAPLE